MPFEIREDAAHHIVEVVYPAEPSAHDVAEYLMKMKRTIDAQAGPWSCLVDQRELKVMEPTLVERVSTLNRYAQAKGMLRSARVVAGSVAALQARKIAENALLRAPVRAFASREEAVAWLTTG